MATIIYQKDKRIGITYAYESVSYWDKKKKQSRSKRKLIGRVKEDGTIVPTDGRGHRKKELSKDNLQKDRVIIRSFYGATYLLDEIGKKLGLIQVLKECFGDRYKEILSIAYYLVLEDSSPLYRFEKWSLLHSHPFQNNIPSQRSSELFASITEENRHQFFKLWGKHKDKDEFWAYDTTSISSYSEQLKQIQYGHNKESDPLAQLNLAIAFGELSNLPFYCRKLSGNIPDSKTLKHLLSDINQLGFNKVKFVLDRGFYSKENINQLYENHFKFIIATRMSLSFVQQKLESIYNNFRSYEYYIPEYELYAHTIKTTWEYKVKRPYKGDTVIKKRRIYLHYYYNIERAGYDEKEFDNKLIRLKEEVLQDKLVKEHESFYKKYFIIKKTPKRGVSVKVNTQAVNIAKRYYGFFVLFSNEKMDAKKALELYRNKDVVEKAFGNLKERLNMRRLLVSSEQSLDGKIFVEFIALIYLSYIKREMQTNNLYKKYTTQSLLDKLDVIECFKYPNKKLSVGEILEEQKNIYKALGVDYPR